VAVELIATFAQVFTKCDVPSCLDNVISTGRSRAHREVYLVQALES